jgi:hypothetical protein
MSFKLDWAAFLKSDFPDQLKTKVNSFLSEAASKSGETAAITGKMTALDFGTEVRRVLQLSPMCVEMLLSKPASPRTQC